MAKTLQSGHRQVYTKGGYKYEHRVMMEKKLGRKLKSDEHIDHINGKPGDNRLSNLRVVSKAQHNKITDRNGGRPKGSKNK
jgi:hypothetical protein